MLKQPQSWNPKDPNENKINNVKTIGVVQNPSQVKIQDQRGSKSNEHPIYEKQRGILDVLKLSPGQKGKSPPMTACRIAGIS